jgi:hypothetical protein
MHTAEPDLGLTLQTRAAEVGEPVGLGPFRGGTQHGGLADPELTFDHQRRSAGRDLCEHR